MKLPRDQGSFKCWASVIRPSDESSRWLQSRWVSSPVIHVPCKVPPLETRATGRQGVENRHWGPSVQPLGSTVFSLASLSSLASQVSCSRLKEKKCWFFKVNTGFQAGPSLWAPNVPKSILPSTDKRCQGATGAVPTSPFAANSNFQEAATPWSHRWQTIPWTVSVKLSDLEILLLPEISLSAQQPEAAFTTWSSTGT